MQQLPITLDRDIVFFDIESTGLNILKDRILQIALVKFSKDTGESSELSLLINPGFPISEDAFKIHGISNEMVANKPTFIHVAKEIFNFIGNADLGGYNSDRFDIPLLIEEFHRVGLHFDTKNRRKIDVQKIFYKMEPRTLKAAYKFYCGNDLTDAHDAKADIYATIEVFKGQITKYKGTDYVDPDGNIEPKPMEGNIETIANFIADNSMLDATQRLKVNQNNQVIFNFGKYTGQVVVDVFKKEPNYYHWIMEKDFSVQVKQIVKGIYEGMNTK